MLARLGCPELLLPRHQSILRLGELGARLEAPPSRGGASLSPENSVSLPRGECLPPPEAWALTNPENRVNWGEGRRSPEIN